MSPHASQFLLFPYTTLFRSINKEADGLEEPDDNASAAEKAAYREKVEELNERTDLMAIEKALVRVEDAKRSEEHTSELQSRGHLVCRLLLEKKKSILLNIKP